MKKLLIAVFFLATTIVIAQDQDTTYWTKGGVSSLTFSQVSLTNWAAGGQNSVAINGNISAFANRIKGRGKWENSLDLAYGLIKQDEASFAKSNDLINFVTKYGYQINNNSGKWFYSGLMDFRTQFYDGVNEEGTFISDFMAPGYLVISLGISFDPSEKWSFSYQPVTGKFTFVGNQDLANQGAFGVEGAVFDTDGVTVLTPGKNTRAEFGSFFRAKYKDKNFESKLELFTGYTENQGEIDVNWQNALVLQLTKVLSMNAFTQLIYDKDILIANEEGELDDRVQFKSVLGIGLTYTFGAQKE